MQSSQYNFLDFMKFLMAICVIAIHSFLKYIPDYPAMEFVIRMAVPFFFITTGFFLGKKLMKPGADHRQICQSHLKKNLPRYLRWIAVYFPIAMLTLFLSDELWYRFAARYVVGVVLIGETPYAWPLWFLLTVVMYLALVYLFFAKGMSLRNVCITGMIILIAGYVYLNVQESLPGFLKEASKFFSPRIPIGFGAITVGILVAYYERNRMFKIWMGSSIASCRGGNVLLRNLDVGNSRGYRNICPRDFCQRGRQAHLSSSTALQHDYVFHTHDPVRPAVYFCGKRAGYADARQILCHHPGDNIVAKHTLVLCNKKQSPFRHSAVYLTAARNSGFQESVILIS